MGENIENMIFSDNEEENKEEKEEEEVDED